MKDDKCITIWESYIGKGAPSNAAGSRRGYGLTKEDAYKNAAHWANQAAWAKERRLTICDQAKPSSTTTRDEKIAWDVVGADPAFEPDPRLWRECAELIRRGKYATAVLRALTA